MPWFRIESLSSDSCKELRRRAIFECCKWDPQVEDVDTLAPFALVLKRHAWRELQQMAETLATETLAAEKALLSRPDLHRALALPRSLRKALAPPAAAGADHLRVMRFDFHPTDEGWRVSEVNCDVPGGYNEASGWTSLVAEHLSSTTVAEDPAARLIEGIRKRLPQGGTVALVHATAYTDDRQVMTFLARKLHNHGIHVVLAAPDHLRWRNGHCSMESDWFSGPIHFVFRFFPAEWLPNLGRQSDWRAFFHGAGVPLCNPATALIMQSKRWPLAIRDLGLNLAGWSVLLPETRDPRDVAWQGNPAWVLKPAFGRVGESIGMNGVTEPREWRAIRRELRWGARHWVAQRRFTPVPIRVDDQPWHVCLGVYTIDGRAAGIYGRVSRQPLINHLARDLAVLVEPCPEESEPVLSLTSNESLRTF